MEIIVRATVLYVFVFILTKGLGRRALAEMSATDLIVIVVMGDMIQQGVTQEDYSITGAMMAIGTLAGLAMALSYLGFRWRPAQRVFQRDPVLLVKDGKPIDRVLKAHRLNISDLCEAAREEGIEDISEIRMAVLEGEGTFSFARNTKDG